MSEPRFVKAERERDEAKRRLGLANAALAEMRERDQKLQAEVERLRQDWRDLAAYLQTKFDPSFMEMKQAVDDFGTTNRKLGAERAESEVDRLRAELADAVKARNGAAREMLMAQAKLERCFSEDHLDTCPYLDTKAKLKAMVEVLRGAVELIESTDWLAFSLSDKAKLDSARAALAAAKEKP